MTVAKSWKQKLAGAMPQPWAREIDIFETQIELRQKNKIEEKLFAETRLRRGVYGQRYDNGQRHDGENSRSLSFPSGELTKGPATMWDAPGMQRIKVPFGKLSAEQLDVLSELAEEYSDSILHVTTRQDIQLHFIHIEDTPDLMRRLAAVGITTREACGNSVRNVTACPYAGVCKTQTFDVTPYANATHLFLLGHDDTQDFGRKFKIAFSGCKDQPCGLTNFHDLGCIAKTQIVDGELKRGFEFYVGGGLGAVPYSARLIEEFLPEEELLPMAQAVCRVFGRLGEKENRSRARIKFLVKKLGTEAFTELVKEERQKLRPDPRWTSFLSDLHENDEKPLRAAAPLEEISRDPLYAAWRRTNVRPQAQTGYFIVVVTLPLGDMTSDQGRTLAELARRFTGDALRTTVDQNLLFRWVSGQDVPLLYEELSELGMAEPGADGITDITACPGTDTCKLGISSSRGLAAELRKQLRVVENRLGVAAKSLHIKCSGCFNSCGQHHVADIGFLGVSRNVNGRRVPHFQLVVGGQWTHNAGSYGLAIGAIPSKNVPAAVNRLTEHYEKERQGDESFQTYVNRVGKKQVRALIEDLIHVPSYDEDPSFYSDWGAPREYTVGDMGVGECAGEVVPFVQMGLAASEREVFEAQLLLDQGDVGSAARRAYSAMLQAARALARQKNENIGEEAAEIVREFRTHFVDTKLFNDPYAGAKFANYLLRVHEDGIGQQSKEGAHQLIEEAQLFVDAAHQCYSRVGSVAP